MLDIETRPALARIWSLWDQNISLPQLIEASEVICFAAKFLDKKNIEFYSVFHDGKDKMIKEAHRLLDEADVIMHYNGTSFDLPHLNREFLLAGLTPPSPYKQIDLFLTVKRQFNFISNKLAFVSKALGLEGKVEHEGFDLWMKCIANDEKAWSRMRRYNIQDVRLLEELYAYLQPWIIGHPHVGQYNSSLIEGCPKCGSNQVIKRGFGHNKTTTFQRWQCQSCGGWSSSRISEKTPKPSLVN